MRPKSKIACAVVTIAGAYPAYASDPTIGAAVSVSIAQQMLAAPPLPSLDGGKFTIAPQYGYVSANVGDAFVTKDGMNFSFAGRVQGNTAGLSLTLPTKGDFGYFLFALGSRVSGDIDCLQDGVHTYSIHDIKSQSYALAGGVSYRFLGDDKSVVAMGAFAGPAMMSIETSSNFIVGEEVGGGAPTKYSTRPTRFGPYFGLQTNVRLGKFRINPYVVTLLDTGDSCTPVESDAPPGSSQTAEKMRCFEGGQGMDSYFGFLGYGLFLGYGSLRFNVYAKNMMEVAYINLTSYSGSIGISF